MKNAINNAKPEPVLYAQKDLVIDGKPYPRGSTVPAVVGAARLANGVKIGSLGTSAPASEPEK